jgi:hypothetical protein
MPTARTALTLVLALLTAVSTPAFADQQHIVPPDQVAATVADRATRVDSERAAIAEALARPEVRNVAEKIGVDLTSVATAAEALDGPDLERAGNTAREVNDQLTGGASSITIGTTTLIIILLVVILLIVAIKH